MKYFAYGSNLCTGRLRNRVPSARPIAVAKLSGYQLHFHKRSDDKSGKANALKTDNGGDLIWGVIFELDDSEKNALDKAERLGRGYNQSTVSVTDKTGDLHEVFIYVADPDAIDPSLRPYSWYLWFVREGAAEHGLPKQYVQKYFESVEYIEDPNTEREAKNRALQKTFTRSFADGGHDENDAFLDFLSEETLKKLSIVEDADGAILKLRAKYAKSFAEEEALGNDWLIEAVEKSEIQPWLDSMIQQRAIRRIGTIESEQPREEWKGPLSELADVAIDLYNKKEYSSIRRACFHLAKRHTFHGKEVNFESLHQAAKGRK